VGDERRTVVRRARGVGGVAPNGQPMWLGYDRPIGGRTVPLYRHAQPTLTDAEREAIAWVLGDVADITGPTEDTLRGLLERTK
jgi:hypothetical protein